MKGILLAQGPRQSGRQVIHNTGGLDFSRQLRIGTQMRAIPLLIIALLVTGCGLSRIRSSQDWTDVKDDRLYLACHVGNYGSGVFLRYDCRDALVLTCSHLTKSGSDVSIYYYSRRDGAYKKCNGMVVAASHPHKEDLALVQCKDIDLERDPFVVPLVAEESFTRGELTVMNIAFGAEDRPFALDCPAFKYKQDVETVIEDKDGSSKCSLLKVLLHGGISQANSGSPVFRGNELVGLVESAPGLAIKDSKLIQGVVAIAAVEERLLELATKWTREHGT